ncbi:DUF1127 domain-containing protein [Pseudomonas sp. KCJK8993]|uniref:DUF1127 domain-containing protein n=1 Tax=Pseudomonas sp. KCJK8993 TaxID=3344565 RepID=UPI0039057C5A
MNSSVRHTGLQALHTWLDAFRNMQERSRTRLLLAQLDERQLADSGISHCERAAELRKPFWRT